MQLSSRKRGFAIVATLLMVFATLPYAGPVQAGHANDLNDPPIATISLAGACDGDKVVSDDPVQVEDIDGDDEVCVVLDGSSSEDPDETENQATCHRTADREIKSFHWFRNGDGAGISDTATEERADETGQIITWGLEVEDWCDDRSENTAEIEIEYVANDDPTAVFHVDVEEDQDGDGNGTLSFDASDSDDNGDIVTYEWTIFDGDDVECTNGTGETLDAECPVGQWSADLTVTDNGGATDSVSVDSSTSALEAIPGNSAPQDPTIEDIACVDSDTTETADGFQCEEEAPVAVEFDGSGTDDATTWECSWNATDGAPTDCTKSTTAADGELTCKWSLSDGATMEETCSNAATHTFSEFGSYDASLEVTDQAGATSETTDTGTVTILRPAPSSDILAESFDEGTGIDFFVSGPGAENSDLWEFSGLAHVSAACMDKGLFGMYLDDDATLQFNRKVAFEGFVPFLGGQSIDATDDTGRFFDPSTVNVDDPRGPRCTYDDEYGESTGEAVLTIPDSEFETENDEWNAIDISFKQWGELEESQDGEDDFDTVSLEAKSAADKEWTLLQSWQELSANDKDDVSVPLNRLDVSNRSEDLQIRFAFEADGDFNDNAGWFVDNLEITGANMCPTASVATPEFVDVQQDRKGTDVTLDATPSFDREDPIETYSWNVIESVNLADDWTATGETVDETLERGYHEFSLSVTDAAGCTDETTLSVTVNEFPVVKTSVDPALNQTDHDGSGDEEYHLNGSESYDPEGTNLTCTWTDEAGDSLGNECAINATFQPSEENVTLTVEDEAGASDSETVSLVIEENPPPIAETKDDRVVRDADRSGDTPVTLDGTGSHDQEGIDGDSGEIESYEWTNTAGDVLASEAKTTVSLSSSEDGEDHNLTLEVVDNGGASDTQDVNVTVVKNALPTMDPQTTCDRMDCTFDANANDDNTDVGNLSCTWSFFDANQTVACNKTLERTFPEPDTYDVNLTITDPEGPVQNWTEFTVGTEGLFVDSFEDGELGEWSVNETSEGTSLWRVGDDCPTADDERDGDHALLFNQESTCNYDVNAHVRGAVERTVDLQNHTEANLTFHHFFDVESGCLGTFDRLTVNATNVSEEDGWNNLATWDCQDGDSGGWAFVDLSLDEHATKKIVLRLEFDSRDENHNEHYGWIVDRLSVW